MTAKHFLQTSLLLIAPLTGAAETAWGQLRVVAYNTLDKPSTSGDLADVDTIFDAIAATNRNGIAKRPDIISLQEQTTFSLTDSTGSRIADQLNTTFGTTTYTVNRIGLGVDRVMVVYDTATVELVTATLINTGGPRQTHRALFRPVGYSSPEANLYLYSSHLSASSSSTRATEASNIRNNADALGGDENIIYLGDMNFGSSGEQGYANYRASGPAQAFDPLNLLTWPNFSIPQHMTQSTRVSSLPDGGAPSGMDDRFDLQIVTEELLDGEGLSYIGPTSSGLSSLDHSYQAFGNDGVSLNSNINNTTVGRSQSAAVLDALFEFSDHLPVVADYQLPAVLDVLTGSVPTTLQEGELFELEVMVSNAADVVAAVGADELDYTLSVNGDLAGSGGGTQAALASAATHFVTLDTSTPGLKSGVLTVSTTSQAAANSLVEIPISFEVLAGGPNGDFNGDGMVDAEDYVVFRDGLSPNGLVSGDYDEFVENFGSGPLAAVASTTVPEPTGACLLLFAVCGGTVRRRR